MTGWSDIADTWDPLYAMNNLGLQQLVVGASNPGPNPAVGSDRTPFRLLD